MRVVQGVLWNGAVSDRYHFDRIVLVVSRSFQTLDFIGFADFHSAPRSGVLNLAIVVEMQHLTPLPLPPA